ncbi:MAG TPA: hypothetical protein VN033_10340 [Vulgatibacter sp.]|nr:hypothetical protein [Vulgatibacter sp.]
MKPLVRHPSGYPADLNNTDTLNAHAFKSLGGGIDAGGARVQNVATPVGANDAVNKTYADSIAQGLYFRDPARAATTANLNLASPGASIDNVILVVDDRVLVKNQTNKAQNGIYLWKGTSVPMVRASDSLRAGVVLWVNEGDIHRDTQWVLSTDATITPDTTPIDFTEARRVAELQAGRSIQISSNTISLKSGAGLTTTGDVAVLPKPSGGITVTPEGVGVDFAGTGSSNQAARSNHTHTAADVGAAPTTRNLIAGNGLTGGGTLAADRTFHVGAGNGIEVTADAVAVKANKGIVSDANGVGVLGDGARGVDVHGVTGVGVKLGAGLAFDGSGNIVTTPAAEPEAVVVHLDPGENISANKVVSHSSNGKFLEARSGTAGRGEVIGIIWGAVVTGALAPVLVEGMHPGLVTGLAVGSTAYLGPSGDLVTTPPATGRIVRIGRQMTNGFLVKIADFGER